MKRNNYNIKIAQKLYYKDTTKIIKRSQTNDEIVSADRFRSMVSVIIPTYNRFETVKKAIRSVLDQTYQNIEIIIVNDCSTDERYYNGELESFEKTKILHLPENLRKKYKCDAAQGKTREEGIKIMKGEWIAFLDDDDYWYPDKLEKQMNEIEKYSKIMNDPILFCSSNMDVGNGSYDPSIPKRPYFLFPLPYLFDKHLIKHTNYINNSTVLLHKSLHDKVGEFVLGKHQDYEYWKRVLDMPSQPKCLYINKPLIYYDLGHGGGQFYK